MPTETRNEQTQDQNTVTLRDRFAMNAIACFQDRYPEQYDGRKAYATAQAAYEIADAMLEVRAQPGPGWRK